MFLHPGITLIICNNIYSISILMGNQYSGIVYNDSDLEITYIFHSSELSPDQISSLIKVREKIVGKDQDKVNGSDLPEDIKKLFQKVKCCYNCKPGRINIKQSVNLEECEDQKPYMTFFAKDKLIATKSIKEINDGRLKVLPNLSVEKLSEKQLGLVNSFANRTDSATGHCPEQECQKAKSESKEFQPPKACVNCGQLCEDLMVCKNKPQMHAECTECFNVRIRQMNANK